MFGRYYGIKSAILAIINQPGGIITLTNSLLSADVLPFGAGPHGLLLPPPLFGRFPSYWPSLLPYPLLLTTKP